MKSFNTSLIRSIRGSLGRFLAIAAIVALGCGFYGGLRMTGPDMRIAADRFYDGTHLYDIRLLSTLGYSETQITDVKAIEGVAALMPSKSTDVMGQINEEQYAMRISTLPIYSLNASTCEDACNVVSSDNNYINRLILAEGRWPTKAGECVISADRVAGVPVQMGDTLKVLYGAQDLDGVLETREFVIVGTAHSSSFVSSVTMGATSLGSGSIQQYAYVSEDNFDADCPYTELFIEVEGAADLFSGSTAYKEHVAAVVARLKDKADVLAQSRLDDLKKKAQETLDKESAEYEDEKADALSKLDEAKQELDEAETELANAQNQVDSGQSQIDSGYEQLYDGYAEFNSQKKDAYNKLAAAKKELEANQKKLDSASLELESKRAEIDALPAQRAELQSQLDQAQTGLTKAQAGQAEIDVGMTQLEQGIAQAKEGLANFDAGISMLEKQLAQLSKDDPSYTDVQAQIESMRQQKNAVQEQLAGLEGQYASLQEQKTLVSAQIAELEAAIPQLQDGIAQIDNGIADFKAAEAELVSGKSQLEAGWKEYYAQEAAVDAQFAAAEQKLHSSEQQLINSQAEVNEGRAELSDGRAELETGRSDYEKERKKALDELSDAAQLIADAQKDIDELEAPDIYVLDRTKNYGVESQVADSERIDNIARLFPFIFFLVAALVALTTMTRMVDEDRVLIGTYKALGYSKARITGRYLIYAGIASALGAVVGLAILSQVLPFTIAKAYAIIYNIPDYPLPMPFDWKISLLSGGLGVGITLFATLGAAMATLHEQPAQLMLPPAPKAGKRILLERITPLWQRVSFSWKVTFRNLFRYKKRMFMTVIGIAGCTALLLTGWGLHDAIWDIIDKQYGPVVNYNVITKMESDATEEEITAAKNYMHERGATEDITRVHSANMQVGSPTHDAMGVEVVIPEKVGEFASLLTMKERISQTHLAFNDNSVVLTEKLARTLGLSVGDSFKLFEQDDIGNALGEGYDLVLTGIMENYIGNWAYIGKDAYHNATGEACVFATLYGRCTEGIDERTSFTEGLHNLKGVQTVTYNDETIDQYRTMLSSVDMIVVVLVVSAAALAFIVLYNLTNINITERRREIASLKVLGFSKREVYAYIFREIILLALLGTILGLLLGTYLESFVSVTAEVDYVMFGRDIHRSSYIISFVMTLLFTGVVMLFMRHKLSDIDMVESLKSVE